MLSSKPRRPQACHDGERRRGLVKARTQRKVQCVHRIHLGVRDLPLWATVHFAAPSTCFVSSGPAASVPQMFNISEFPIWQPSQYIASIRPQHQANRCPDEEMQNTEIRSKGSQPLKRSPPPSHHTVRTFTSSGPLLRSPVWASRPQSSAPHPQDVPSLNDPRRREYGRTCVEIEARTRKGGWARARARSSSSDGHRLLRREGVLVTSNYTFAGYNPRVIKCRSFDMRKGLPDHEVLPPRDEERALPVICHRTSFAGNILSTPRLELKDSSAATHKRYIETQDDCGPTSFPRRSRSSLLAAEPCCISTHQTTRLAYGVSQLLFKLYLRPSMRGNQRYTLGRRLSLCTSPRTGD